VPWEQLSGRIAYVRGDTEIILIDPSSRTVRLVARAGPYEMVRDVTWHPGGTSLTVTLLTAYPVANWSLASIDVRTGGRSDLYPTVLRPTYPAWSRDGRIAFVAPLASALGLFIDGVPVSPGLDVEVMNAPSWSPDGSTLAVVVHGSSPALGVGDLHLVDVATGAASPLGPVDCSEPRFSPDGTRVVYQSMPIGVGPAPTGQLRFASVPGGAETHVSGADFLRPSHPAWSPDGSTLVVQGHPSYAPSNLYLVDASTGGTTQLTAKGGQSPAWTP
jgi:Tol biopolymer transport system component